MNVLLTGGAGFIGTSLVMALAEAGNRVSVLDNLSQQVHQEANFLKQLSSLAECRVGDVRDADAIGQMVGDVDVVVHLAAETGTGQSMYESSRYTNVNVLGTATLLDVLVQRARKLRRVVLASSRSVYGEGQYQCDHCGIVHPSTRSENDLAEHKWDPCCPHCNTPAAPVATPEDAILSPQSIYACTKQSQEQLVRLMCRAHGWEYVILRYQNVYGPGQSLINPYSGVLCTFFAQILSGAHVILFEDGRQSRDFVFIDDVTAVTRIAVENERAAGLTVNVGTGARVSIAEMANQIAASCGRTAFFEISQRYRPGDVRHCSADLNVLIRKFGYIPRVEIANGLRHFTRWALCQPLNFGQVLTGIEKARRAFVNSVELPES